MNEETENMHTEKPDEGIVSFEDAIAPQDSGNSNPVTAQTADTVQDEQRPVEETVQDAETPSAENTQATEDKHEEEKEDEEPIITFDSFGFCPEIMQAINEAGFREPTPIQVKAIPPVMEGKDVIGQALTGTGKTAAFGLPIMQKIMNEPGLNMLVLVPTRELAAQVSNELFKLGRYANIHTAAFTGGQSYSRQETILAKGINALVATPGRLLDLIDSGHFDDIAPKHIVVDEADEMLDMGFLEDVQKIFEHFNSDHQTMLFSATMPPPVIRLAESILKNPVNITTSIAESTNNDIEQLFYVIEDSERSDAVIRLIDAENVTKGMIFCRTKEETDSLNILLSARGYNVNCLHGDMEQAQRSRVMAAFRRGEIDILVATDVAARGLDVDDVSHVFNYHLPFDSRGYVHRIGRTGRAGKTGTAITLVTPREIRQLEAIKKNVGAQLQNRLIPTRTQVTEQRLKKIFHDVHDYKLDVNILNQVQTLAVNQDLLVIIAKLISHQLQSCGDQGPEHIGIFGTRLERLLTPRQKRRERGDRGDREERGDRRGRGRRGDREDRGGRRERREYDAWANEDEQPERSERRPRREYDAWAHDDGQDDRPRTAPGNLDRPSYAENAPNMREATPVEQPDHANEAPAKFAEQEPMHHDQPEHQELPENRPVADSAEPVVHEKKHEHSFREERDERPKRRFEDERPKRRFEDERPKRRFEDERPKRRFEDERPRFSDERPKRRFEDERPKRRFEDERPRYGRDGKVNVREIRENDSHAPRKGKWAEKFQDTPSKKHGYEKPASAKSSFAVPAAPKDKKKAKRNLPPPPPQVSKRGSSPSGGKNWYFN